ncbi:MULTISPECIES: hypothetical protein [unclassified Streptomyces]|uniref:hypothetical protein n=1 Tax=unclassified Streptomyces TaxID=2593676 RepID=UPI002E153748|nr:hypothetical protein OG457_10110 [Streptomyces sp. NBC_01207]WTA17424.1 hypothetical protein OG365_04800 [Streptomyces sp. NBC_00853]
MTTTPLAGRPATGRRAGATAVRAAASLAGDLAPGRAAGPDQDRAGRPAGHRTTGEGA